MSDDDDAHPLVLALEAAQANRLDAVLVALLQHWREAPDARVADLIDVVGAAVAAPADGLYGDDAIAAWDQRAGPERAIDVPALLRTLTSAQARVAALRVARMPDDPRVDAALVQWCTRPPFSGKSSQPWWAAVLARFARLRDRRQIAPLRALGEPRRGSPAEQRLHVHLANLAQTLEAGLPRIEPPVIVVELERALSHLGARAPDTRLADLLRAVHDSPDDDGPRMVYADALLERSDPRGELIVMQLVRAGERSQKEKKLVAGMRKGIVGDLAPVVAETVIERGFLAACTVDPHGRLAAVQRLAGHPAWATVRDLEGSAIIALHAVMRGLRAYGFTAQVAADVEHLPDAPEELLAGAPRPLEELRYSGRSTGDALLATCPALPRLRRLVLRRPGFVRGQRFNPGEAASIPIWVDALAAAPVLDRLDRLAFDVALPQPLDGFRPLFAAGRARVVQIGVGPVELVVERGTRDYERASLAIGLSSWVQLEAFQSLFDVLPHTVKAIRIRPRRLADRSPAEYLRIVAARRAGVEATVEL